MLVDITRLPEIQNFQSGQHPSSSRESGRSTCRTGPAGHSDYASKIVTT